MRGRLLLGAALGLQRLDKLHRINDAAAVGAGGGGGEQILHHFLARQGGVHLPAQRHDPGAIGDAPAQAAVPIVGVAVLPGGVFLGYKPQSGEEVVIVEDVITAGTAIRESMAILSKLDGVKVSATFVMVDRKEKGKTEKSAMAEVSDEFGFPVYSVVDVYDIIEYLEEDESNRENVDRIKAYLAVNGAKSN